MKHLQGSPDDWVLAHPSTAHLVIEVAVTTLAWTKLRCASLLGVEVRVSDILPH